MRLAEMEKDLAEKAAVVGDSQARIAAGRWLEQENEELKKQIASLTLDQEEKNTPHPPWIGFEVTSSACVRSGGPAAECGIAVGDNIKKVGEWAVSTLDDIRRIVKDHVRATVDPKVSALYVVSRALSRFTCFDLLTRAIFIHLRTRRAARC